MVARDRGAVCEIAASLRFFDIGEGDDSTTKLGRIGRVAAPPLRQPVQFDLLRAGVTIFRRL
jgi:hypothetical protein